MPSPGLTDKQLIADAERLVAQIRALTERMEENNRRLDRLLGLPEPRPELTLLKGGADA
jgi:hypothetical protein